jgi:hypothetical protein
MGLADRVDGLAARLPDDDPRKGADRARIAALADECGCRMGGMFFFAAAAVGVAYLVAIGPFSPWTAALAAGVALAASLLGKLIGLGVARLRLLWLERLLTARLSDGSSEVTRVDVH